MVGYAPAAQSLEKCSTLSLGIKGEGKRDLRAYFEAMPKSLPLKKLKIMFTEFIY